MTSAAKQKGSAAEREAASIINSVLGTDVKRNLEQSRGISTADIIVPFEGKIYFVEVKRRETLSRIAWFKQAESHAVGVPNGVPVVAYKQNRLPWKVYWRNPRHSKMEALLLTDWLAGLTMATKPKKGKLRLKRRSYRRTVDNTKTDGKG